MALCDTEGWFRMNAYIPEDIKGGAQLVAPHGIKDRTYVSLQVVGDGDPGWSTEVFVFYNNRTIADKASGCLDVLKCSGGLESTLPQLGFEGPYAGPPYDVNIHRPREWGI